MKFGEKIRQLRNDKQLTQPELAQALGIEQSYLSKLENDKSLPSNDVLNRMLDFFAVDVAGLMRDMDPATSNQMRQIPDVAEHFRHQKQLLIGNQKRWLLLSALMLSLGLALVYAGRVHLFFPDTVYQYKSHGIVLKGEPKEIFRRPTLVVPDSAGHEARLQITDAIKARTDEEFLLLSEFRGEIFSLPVSGGSRTYYLSGEMQIDPRPSKFVVFLGVLLSVLGLFALILERKLSRP